MWLARSTAGIGSIKKRARGVSAGEILVGLAQSQLLGGDALVALDRQRQDVAAAELSAVPGIASTTAGSLARRFGAEQVNGIEAATAELVGQAFELFAPQRRAALSGRVTIDMDSTDVEVYGSCKQGVAYNYAGQRSGRPHLATWAEAAVTTAAELLAGNDDVRPRAASMLRRGLAGIPAPVRAAAAANDRLRVRADAGYFTADLAIAAVEQGCDFAVAAKGNTAMWRAYASIADEAWADAIGMPGAQVAAVDYAPAGWPDGTYTIVRRVRVEAETISADPRSRRRRTIDPEQLALALAGTATHAYAVSFIVTNIPTHNDEANDDPVLDVEAWLRRRTDIEDRIREAKHGAALRHLPSRHHGVNTVWMWAALLAGTSRSSSKRSPGSTTTPAPTPPGSATNCSASPHAWYVTAATSPCGCHQASNSYPRCWSGSENSPPRPDAAPHPSDQDLGEPPPATSPGNSPCAGSPTPQTGLPQLVGRFGLDRQCFRRSRA